MVTRDRGRRITAANMDGPWPTYSGNNPSLKEALDWVSSVPGPEGAHPALSFEFMLTDCKSFYSIGKVSSAPLARTPTSACSCVHALNAVLRALFV
jgi:hypothetical protein